MHDKLTLTGWSLGDEGDLTNLWEHRMLKIATKVLTKQPAISYSTAKEHGIEQFLIHVLMSDKIGTSDGREKDGIVEAWKAGHVVLLFGMGGSAIGVLEFH